MMKEWVLRRMNVKSYWWALMNVWRLKINIFCNKLIINEIVATNISLFCQKTCLFTLCSIIKVYTSRYSYSIMGWVMSSFRFSMTHFIVTFNKLSEFHFDSRRKSLMTEAISIAALKSENIIKATVECVVSGSYQDTKINQNLEICIFSGIYLQFWKWNEVNSRMFHVNSWEVLSDFFTIT